MPNPRTPHRFLLHATLVFSLSTIIGCDSGPANKAPEKPTPSDGKVPPKCPECPPAPVTDALVTNVEATEDGFLLGYLKKEELPDSLALLPPPPAKDSPMNAHDEAASKAAYALKGTPRWDLAIRDAAATFPATIETFNCALGVPIGEAETPNLYRMMRRVWMDAMMSTGKAKKAYERLRPYQVHKEHTCHPPEDEVHLVDPSYPSGHTALGFAYGLILAEIAPDRINELLQRGHAYGQSRMICNAHWNTDVLSGRIMGAATVAKLRDIAAFRADLTAAKADVAAARAKNLKPTQDCAAEAAALAVKIPGAM